MDGVVARLGEREVGELVRVDLGLLHQQQVGLVQFEELEHARQAHVQRVDVPGGDLLHRRALHPRRVAWRPMVRWVVSVMVGVVVLAAACPARAGTYEVNACAGGSVNRSWVASNSNDAAFDVKPGCPFEVYSAVTPGATAGFFEAAWWRLTAPAGTVIDRLRLARYGYRFVDRNDRPEGGQAQGGWTTGAYVTDNGAVKPIAGESCLVQPGAYLCDFGSKNTSAPVDLDLNATQVTYQVACVRDGGTCDTESDGFPLAGMTIFNAVATVRDDTAPTVSAGGPLLATGLHRPYQEPVDASDATGIPLPPRPPAPRRARSPRRATSRG